jgi:exodeoxyribonuclease VIII
MKKVKDSNAEYHSKNSLSSSALKTIYKSSVKAWKNLKITASKAMNYGTAVHTALLEPDVFKDEIAIKPVTIDRRTKDGKEAYSEFIEASAGKIVIEQNDLDMINAIVDEVYKKPNILHYLNGDKELSHYNKFMDLDFRCRPDVINYNDNFISDVKTCQDTHPAAFNRDAVKWAYHLQAAFYSDFCGVPMENFRFIIVMSKMVDGKPYADAQLIKMDDKFLAAGRAAYKEAIEKYKFYKNHDIEDVISWPYIDDNDESYIIKGYGKY